MVNDTELESSCPISAWQASETLELTHCTELVIMFQILAVENSLFSLPFGGWR